MLGVGGPLGGPCLGILDTFVFRDKSPPSKARVLPLRSAKLSRGFDIPVVILSLAISDDGVVYSAPCIPDDNGLVGFGLSESMESRWGVKRCRDSQDEVHQAQKAVAVSVSGRDRSSQGPGASVLDRGVVK